MNQRQLRIIEYASYVGEIREPLGASSNCLSADPLCQARWSSLGAMIQTRFCLLTRQIGRLRRVYEVRASVGAAHLEAFGAVARV